MSGNTTLDLSAATILRSVSLGSLAAASGSPQVLLGGNTLETGLDNSNTTFSGTISGSGGLIKSGSGTFTLLGVNTYAGGATLNGGELSLGNSGALPFNNTIIFNGGTLQATAANTADFSALFSQASWQNFSIDTNGQTVTWGTALNSSGGSLTKLGAGTLVLAPANAANAYNLTTVGAGTLLATTPASLPGYNIPGSVSVAGGAVLAVRTGNGTTGWSSGQIDNLLTNTTWSGSTSTLGIDTTNGSFTYGSSITKPLALAKLGSNTLTLTGAEQLRRPDDDQRRHAATGRWNRRP